MVSALRSPRGCREYPSLPLGTGLLSPTVYGHREDLALSSRLEGDPLLLSSELPSALSRYTHRAAKCRHWADLKMETFATEPKFLRRSVSAFVFIWLNTLRKLHLYVKVPEKETALPGEVER